jgi:hypothetical protein
MKTYKSFSLPGGGVLRINDDKIIATISAPGNKEIEIYCSDRPIPFHVTATKHTPQQIMDYVWDIHDTEEGY